MTPRVAVFVDLMGEYGRDILAGVSAYARTHGQWTFFGDPERVAQPVAQIEVWQGDGVIAQLFPAQVDLLRVARRRRIPVVNVSDHVGGIDMPTVLPDNLEAGRLAARYFLGRGFRHMGYCGFTGHHYSEVRHRGFADVLAEAGRECSIYHSDPPQERFDEWPRRMAELTAWVESLPRPVAVLCCNDVRARHVAHAAHTLGRRIPEDLSLLGVDNDELVCEMSDPPLSSVDLSADRIGYEAAALLDRLMNPSTRDPTRSPPRVLLPPAGVIERRSSDVLALDDEAVAAAVRFIRTHAHEPIDVPRVVAATSASRRVLERRFQHVLGRTILQEIASARIARARRLLIDSDLSAERVAERCGFGYVQQFNALFKRVTGQTPGQFRGMYRLR